MGRCDLGDQILLKIQSARNHVKLNGSIGLVITKPTQLVWVKTDIGSKRYHVLFKMTNWQKKGDVDCTVCTDADMAVCMTHGRDEWQIVEICGRMIL